MQAAARLERLESRNRRSAPRRQLSLGSTLPETGDDALILDLSSTGILIETKADLATFEQLQLTLPEIGQVVATVIWNSGQYFGCEFLEPIPQAVISAALLRSPFAEPAAVRPSLVSDDIENADAGAEEDRYPLGVRLRVIVGASLLLWALILWIVGLV